MADTNEDGEIASNSFYNASSSFIRKILYIIDQVSTRKDTDQIQIAELLKLVRTPDLNSSRAVLNVA